jgi:hypothetical protein
MQVKEVQQVGWLIFLKKHVPQLQTSARDNAGHHVQELYQETQQTTTASLSSTPWG